MSLEDGRNLRGYVREFNNRKKYMFITLEGASEDLFGHCDDIDAPGGHFCLFTRGQAVLFDRIVTNGNPRAVNIRLENPPEIPEYEESIITVWGPEHKFRWGFARRECPLCCEIFVHRKRILSSDEGIASLKPGSRIRHGIVKTLNGWVASNIDIFVDVPEANVVTDSQNYASETNVVKGSHGSEI